MTKNNSLTDMARDFYSKGLDVAREIADSVFPQPYNFAVAGGRAGGGSYASGTENSSFNGLDSRACLMSSRQRVRDRRGNHTNGHESRTYMENGRGDTIQISKEQHETREDRDNYLRERNVSPETIKKIGKYFKRTRGNAMAKIKHRKK